MTPLLRRAALVLAGSSLALGLAGCGDDAPADSPATTAVATEEPTTEEPTTEAPTTEPAAAAAGGVCGLVEESEVTAVLGAGATTPPGGSIGDLSPSGFGGQCLWTSAAGNLEVNVWVPDSVNPPPGEAPAAGSDQVVDIDNGAYAATDTFVYLVKVTGNAASDDAKIAAAKALVPVVRGRL